MKTKKITIHSNGQGMEKALDTVEAFSLHMGFNPRDSRRARLLAEETLSMVRGIVMDFEAEFWMESMPDCSCELHLLAIADMDYAKKYNLVATSTQQRNEASVGIMGKIRDFIEDSIFYMCGGLTMPPADPRLMGNVSYADIQVWSLQQYRKDMEELKQKEADSDLTERLEELERSIVANIADDVQVSVEGDNIEMVIRKNFPMTI